MLELITGAVFSCLLRMVEIRAGLVAQAHGGACCFASSQRLQRLQPGRNTATGKRHGHRDAEQVPPTTLCVRMPRAKGGNEMGDWGREAEQGHHQLMDLGAGMRTRVGGCIVRRFRVFSCEFCCVF